MKKRIAIQTPIATLVLLIIGIFSVTLGHAGVGDTPLPDYPPRGKYFYSIPGVIKSSTQETVFRCTVVKSKNATTIIAVEVFDATGTLLSQGNIGGSTGSTLSIATGTIASETNAYFNSLSSFKGSARIISNAKRLLCDAYVTDKNTNPPTSMRSLPVIKKTIQRGD